MKITQIHLAFALAMLALAPGIAYAGCSNNTLQGAYSFTITGQILAPSAAAGPVSGVAITKFDGEGGLTQLDHVVHNGTLPLEAWRPGSGSYSINSNCTGWMTIVAHPSNTADAGPPLLLFIVVSENGNTIRTVVSGSPASPAFSSSILSEGSRISPADGFDNQ